MLEIICTILGLIQGILIALNKRSNWFFYLLQMAGLFVFSWINHLYGDAVNDAIYFVIGIIGYARWGNQKGNKITVANRNERFIYITLIIISIIGFNFFLKRTNDPCEC